LIEGVEDLSIRHSSLHGWIPVVRVLGEELEEGLGKLCVVGFVVRVSLTGYASAGSTKIVGVASAKLGSNIANMKLWLGPANAFVSWGCVGNNSIVTTYCFCGRTFARWDSDPPWSSTPSEVYL
jgi:hypothetical protein